MTPADQRQIPPLRQIRVANEIPCAKYTYVLVEMLR